MLTDQIINSLGLRMTGTCVPSAFRVFSWPEFEHLQATFRECSLLGNRLAKKDHILLTFLAAGELHGVILNNERLDKEPSSLRYLISSKVASGSRY